MRHGWLVGVVVAVSGCAVGGTETSTVASDQGALSSDLMYFYVSPVPADAMGFGPLALRRANAKPSTLNPTYGAAILPGITLAADATTTQAALDAVLAISYAGNENRVVAIVGGRDRSSPWEDPLFEVVELYTPSQAVAIADGGGLSGVAQRDALYHVAKDGSKTIVNLVNEKDYPGASSLAYDYSATTDPAAAAVAVQGGALFTGKVDVSCKKVLWLWTKCDPPTGVHVAAYFEAN